MSVTPIFQVQYFSKAFGGLQAVDNVSLDVEQGAIHALIGPNGAGKSTLFNLITGVTPVDTGSLYFKGQDITALHSYRRVELGMARTFQNLQIFPELSVLENVMVGRHCRTHSGFLDSLLNTRRNRKENQESEQIAYELLAQLGLQNQALQPAGQLSYGQAKLMEIARAMASEPSLLLLDEPLAGLPASAIDFAEQAILKLNELGVTIVLVEHNVRVVMRLSHQISVLNNGCLLTTGTPEEVRHNPAVLEAYLGEDSHA